MPPKLRSDLARLATRFTLQEGNLPSYKLLISFRLFLRRGISSIYDLREMNLLLKLKTYSKYPPLRYDGLGIVGTLLIFFFLLDGNGMFRWEGHCWRRMWRLSSWGCATRPSGRSSLSAVLL